MQRFLDVEVVGVGGRAVLGCGGLLLRHDPAGIQVDATEVRLVFRRPRVPGLGSSMGGLRRGKADP
jgi:hypothetical protein